MELGTKLGTKPAYEAPSVRDLGTLAEITGSNLTGHNSEGGQGGAHLKTG
jgi:hypothetical protein